MLSDRLRIRIPIRFVHRLVSLVLVLAFGISVLPLTQAQNNISTATPASITITGVVESNDNSGLVVSGIRVEIGTAQVDVAELTVGTKVEVTGTMNGGVIVATVIIIINDTSATPTPLATTPTSTPDPNATPSSTPTPTATQEFDGTIIVIEGPITHIDIDIHVITIFDIDIHVRPDDPILQQVKIGDIIRVIGDIDLDGDTIIIVAVNIIIVNIVIIDVPNPGLPNGCKISKKGKIKCSRKRR